MDSLNPDTSFKDWIASDLRFYREREGLSLPQLGEVMGAAKATVSNLEHARDGWNLNEDQAEKLDAFLGLNHHFRRLVRYARTAHDPDWFAEYAMHEAKALVIRSFRLSYCPGIFQTPEYARALLREAGLEKDVEAAVESRLKRQEVLTRENPPYVWVVMDEDVLHRQVGDREVFRAQLAKLHEVATLPNVTIRIVPKSAGFYLGLDGSFNTLAMPKGELVFVEAPGGGRLIQDSAEVRDFGVRWDLIGACALPWDVTLALLAQAMERFS
ncbi:helix-turn-helix domain-containing protein [Actinomadura oligospora]|uniref:helix-turn-helix domain-containing protein n=1 Tax=Actinomadura oligospora TaxID=111804 RepID=UPI0012F75114|nr:helix-turn-helix transcriptional regulator [Actinomadura oligospora]